MYTVLIAIACVFAGRTAAAVATADTIPGYVEMPTTIKEHVRPDFIKKGRPLGYLDHEVLIAVKQSNLDVLEQEVINRSTPGQPNYRKWLTMDEVNAIRSNHIGAQAITDWLITNGVQILWTSNARTYIKATTTVSHWEELLQTSFHIYEGQKVDQTATGFSTTHRQFLRADRYFVPSSIHEHVHAFLDVSDLPARVSKHAHSLDRQGKTDAVQIDTFEWHPDSAPGKTFARAQTKAQSTRAQAKAQLKKSVRNLRTRAGDTTVIAQPRSLAVGTDPCDGYASPACLNYVYNIASNTGSTAATQAVFEMMNNGFSQEDLTDFQYDIGSPLQAALSVGGENVTICKSDDDYGIDGVSPCDEGNLDIQYIMGMAQATVSTFYYVDTGSNNDVLGYAIDLSDMVEPYMVNSISYGYYEPDLTAEVLSAFDVEMQALAARGVTMMASSGDDGVANFQCQCNGNSGSSSLSYSPAGNVTYTGQGYFPAWPASSPWITAVGATQGPETHGLPEIACQSTTGGVITTGGGFSTYYAAPSWQTNAINQFFNHTAADGHIPAPGYDPVGRGYPDVSMLGAFYPIIINGQVNIMFGTSASSPVFAGLVSLLNALRLTEDPTAGGAGWLNPLLYSAGDNVTFTGSTDVIFTDVTVGNNSCCASQDPKTATCCTAGFTSTTGWDPVTGWGSITFTNFAQLFGFTVPNYQPPTDIPTFSPTQAPTEMPSASPTFVTTAAPTPGPNASTAVPTQTPTQTPTLVPTPAPTPGGGLFTTVPTLVPTPAPTYVITMPPTVMPTTSPTMAPTFPVGAPVIAFSAALVINNVTKAAFSQDAAAQLASRNATAFSMPGITLDQVTISNISDSVIAAAIVSTSVSTRVLAGAVPSIDVTYVITTDQDQLAVYCTDCSTNATASFSYLSSSLNTAVSSGSYTASLQTSSNYYGATVTDYASSDTPVQYTNVVSYTVTGAPSVAPTAAGAGSSSNNSHFSVTIAVIGAAAVVVVMVLGGCFFYTRRRNQQPSAQPSVVSSVTVTSGASLHKSDMDTKDINVLHGESTNEVFNAMVPGEDDVRKSGVGIIRSSNAADREQNNKTENDFL